MRICRVVFKVNYLCVLLFVTSYSPRALATSADFNKEIACYSALISKNNTLQTGYDSFYRYKGGMTLTHVMRPGEHRTATGFFLYSRSDVIFIQVDVESMKEHLGHKWLRLEGNGLDQAYFGIIEAPNNLGNLLTKDSLADPKVAANANRPKYVENVDATVARKALLNDIKSGIPTVHEYFTVQGQLAKQIGAPDLKKQEFIHALKTCSQINELALREVIQVELAKFAQ